MQFLDDHHYADNGNASSMNIHRKALGLIVFSYWRERIL